MKLNELKCFIDPAEAANEMTELNQQMVDATGEYRALKTPESLKKVQDLEDKIQKILSSRGKVYGWNQI